MCRKSIPASESISASSRLSSSLTPTFLCSGEILTPRMKSSGTLFLTSCMILMRNLALSKISPPHTSSLLFVFSPRNWQIRYPWAPCSSTPSNPALAHLEAASPNAEMIDSISSYDSSLEVSSESFDNGFSLADTGRTPVIASGANIPPWNICAKLMAPLSLIPVESLVSPGTW